MPAKASASKHAQPFDDRDAKAADTRMLTSQTDQEACIESSDAEIVYDCSADYDEPKLGATLTATQVIDLLRLGKT